MAACIELLGAVVWIATLANRALVASAIQPFDSDALSKKRVGSFGSCFHYYSHPFMADNRVISAPG
jgi:hypothetical protein